ncbi:transposase [Novipirellula artificiosorum]|uniref:Transposase IS200 like protein n=1 Tax=Novipirellula artificiosorum TaxID=2528016 RepID=A0A5C6D1N3_9BACT|nr:transposase [Novipirellula artificiosorum]TWU28819.1 Transposase IS200 like protein [Novipirellula artificiosorum]
MPRQKRADEAGAIYHALNRGNARQEIFHKDQDYEAFVRVLHEGLEKYDVNLFSFTLMPNHWHLLLRPNRDGQMGKLLRWVTATHTLRYHGHYDTRGEGHLYQSRFKSFPIQDDAHFYVVCRYIERNPVRAKLVSRSQLWKHGSLYRWNQPSEPVPRILSPWPIARLPNWIARVNEALSEKELRALRVCVDRGRPYGSTEWIEETAEKSGLWFTLRPLGRPRKKVTE